MALTDALVFGLLRDRAVGSARRWPPPSSCPLKPLDEVRAYESPPRPARPVAGRPARRPRRAPARGRRARRPRARPGLRPQARQRGVPAAAEPGGSPPTTPSPGAWASPSSGPRSSAGRPSPHDLRVAFTIWGFLDEAPPMPSSSRCARRGSPRWPTRTTTPRPAASSTPCPSDAAGPAATPTGRVRTTCRPAGARSSTLVASRPRTASLPVRALAHGLPPRRRRPHRPVQLALRPPDRRRVPAAHRGHRHRAQPARADRRHPALDPVARPGVGRRAGAPVRPPRPPPRGRRRSSWPSGHAFWSAWQPARRGERPARAAGAGPRRRPRAGRGPGAALPGARRRARPSFTDLVRGDGLRRQRRHRGLRARAGQRHADVPARQRRRRRRHGDHPRPAGRGARQRHARSTC